MTTQTQLTYLDRANDISIGPGTCIRIECSITKRSASSIYIGALPETHFVILPPGVYGGDETLVCEAGNSLDINYIQDGAMIRFSSVILRVVTDPVELLVLEFPRDARRYELRGHKRISCFLATAVTIYNDVLNKTFSGTIRDISKTGCRLCFVCDDGEKGVFSINEKITIRCQFPGIAGEQESAGVIRDIRQATQEITIGIQFLDIAWWVPPYD